MRRRPSTRASDLAAALCVAGALISDIGAARADNAVIPDLPAQVGLRGTIGDRLALEAFVNGRSAKQIIEAHIDANNELSAPRGELKSIGLKVSSGSDDALIKLSSIPGLAYRYDEPGQAIYFDAPESMLAPKVFSATPHPTPSLSATSDIGVMINYDAYGASSAWSLNHRLSFGGASLSLDGRIFSPLGFISQSGVIGTTAMTDRTALRLDTTWQYDDEQHEISYRAGDFINSGLAWTRPIRMGGLQIARDFALRPDLVTSPLASASGTAAVPSSVDVLVNNFKVYTQDVDPGPFRIDNLPVVGDNGTTTLVMHDITGKEVTQTSPFFISSRLLAPGVFDYSVEGGYARTYYGEQSFSYAPGLIGSATLRGGLTDWATVEAHTEDGDGLINAGAGLALNAFNRGVVEAALAGSRYAGGNGMQYALGFSTAIAGVTIDASSQRTFASYSDLAEITTPWNPQSPVPFGLSQLATSGTFLSPLVFTTSVAPPRALDRLSLTFPQALSWAALNLSYVNETQSDGVASRIASVGVSHNFSAGGSAFAQVFTDFANRRDSGFVFGLSWTFDKDVTASSQYSSQGGVGTATTQVSKPASQEIGSLGWSATDTEGGARTTQAQASYLSPYGRATVTASEYGLGSSSSVVGSGEFAGSVSVLGASVLPAPTISDSFALVDVGAPNVTVLEDNRPIGVTGASGKLIVTNLRGYQENKIAIDPTSVPVDAQTTMTETSVRPRGRSGVVANFHVATDAHDADLILVDDKGTPVTAGARIDRANAPSSVVGYDGRAYLDRLDAHNAVSVLANGKACTAEFDYARANGAPRPTLGPIVCHASAVVAK